jgi:hypothetical protein
LPNKLILMEIVAGIFCLLKQLYFYAITSLGLIRNRKNCHTFKNNVLKSGGELLQFEKDKLDE